MGFSFIPHVFCSNFVISYVFRMCLIPYSYRFRVFTLIPHAFRVYFVCVVFRFSCVDRLYFGEPWLRLEITLLA